jgi:hypothetical protein
MVEVVQRADSHEIQDLDDWPIIEIKDFIFGDIVDDFVEDEFGFSELNVLLAVPLFMWEWLGLGLFECGGECGGECGIEAFFEWQFRVDLGEFQELEVGATLCLVVEKFVLDESLPWERGTGDTSFEEKVFGQFGHICRVPNHILKFLDIFLSTRHLLPTDHLVKHQPNLSYMPVDNIAFSQGQFLFDIPEIIHFAFLVNHADSPRADFWQVYALLV